VAGQTLRFARAVLATGGRARAPAVPGLEEAGYLTNETVFNLTTRPPRLGVIGGGPIGCELAQAFQRLGSQVTLVHTGSHLLNKEDADAAEIVQDAILRDGVHLALSARLLAVEKRGAEKVLRYADAADKTYEILVDEILVAVGRTPNVEGLGLEAAGVVFEARTGVQVDDYLRTTNRRVFAAGDVASRYQFTHMADFLARTVLANALFPGRQKVSALTIPGAPTPIRRLPMSASQSTRPPPLVLCSPPSRSRWARSTGPSWMVRPQVLPEYMCKRALTKSWELR
jgi:pyruvate/2-oxoglutarate dehydrogenase complex dihydrolipoamide dehydrogenase (E3) component